MVTSRDLRKQIYRIHLNTQIVKQEARWPSCVLNYGIVTYIFLQRYRSGSGKSEDFSECQ